MDLVSVIMPYYKKKKYIKKSIISVLNQTYKNFEIILIYDDESLKDLNYIKKLTKKDKRIRLIINKKNLGAGKSRNIAIKKSKGDFIAFLDCDDTWVKKKLFFQLNFMNKNNLNFTHTSYKILNNKNKVIEKRLVTQRITFKNLKKSCDIGLSTVMIKKSILFKNDNFPNLKTKEDYVLWLKISKRGIIIYGLNKFLTNWKKLNNSLSSSTIQKFYDSFRVYNKYLKYNFFVTFYCILRLSINFLLKKYV